MTNTTSDLPEQVGINASNPYLVCLLRRTLGEQHYTIQRLASEMDWDQEVSAHVTKLALELGLIPDGAKAKKRFWLVPDPEDVLILPMMLQPRTEPASIKKPEPLGDPAPWGLVEVTDPPP